MIGLSYMSYTSWQAATQAPPALKAIITAGDLIDQYQFAYSPQGARSAFNDAYLAAYSGVLTAASGYASTNTAHLARTGCNQGIADIQGVLSGLATGDRNAAFWEERSLSRKLPAVRSAVLDAPGFFDEGPHQYQDATIWGSIPASTPKVQVRGWWGHDFPNEYSAWATRFDFPSGTTTWEKLTFGWFDYWLKGIGPEPRTDVVYHQDQDLHWREARGWSPSANTKETLFLDGDALAPVPRAGTTTFVSAFQPADEFFDLDALAELVSPGAIPDDAGLEYGLCPDQKRLGVARAYVSAPVKATTQIAGNPFADLTVSDDQAGGQITATMFDLAPDSSCVGPYVQGARWIAAGAADLNFYNSPYRATPFPIGTPTEVRIDLTDTSYTLHAGHRLALLLNYGEIGQATPGTAPASTITVHGARPDVNAARASHLVVPVDGGTFGGSSPTLTYPPRPFTPPGYRD
jgi:putative CocE/NonD family hydrolase